MLNSDRLFEIFNEAQNKPAGAERERFVAEASQGEAELRREVLRLLKNQEQAGDFLLHGFSPATEVSAEQPGDIIGRFKLLEKVGEGGCGIVYVAEQTQPVRRRVALKVIKLGMDTRQVVARFEAERQALAMMDHPNIAKVFDAGATETGRPYFVMELVRGLRMTEFCDENQLSVKERLDLFITVCHAIQHAHQKGVIHRDIKPSNILVTLHDGVPVAKVIDFGIAKAIEGRLTDATVYTQLLQFVGTPAYMSPEQAELSGLDIDTRSDIYSLGVLLYELLTGETPFDGQKMIASGIDAMRKTIRETEPLPPSTRLIQRSGRLTAPHAPAANSRSDVPSDLDWIVMKCLEKDRSRRYETANALSADLQRHLRNEPVEASPPSTIYRLQKTWQRNRISVSAGAAVILALVVGISLSTWQAFEARRARNAAQHESENARAEQKKAQKAEASMKEARLQAEHQLYVANMKLAGEAWEKNNFMGLRQLLEDTRGAPERGFEWYYWQRQAHLYIHSLRGHTGPVRSVMFSPDGQRLVTGGDDTTVRVWNATTCQNIFTLNGHTGPLKCVAFSPDSQQIASASEDKTIRFWDASTGGLTSSFTAGSGAIRSVAFSPNGKLLVSAGDDHMVKIWSVDTRDLITTLQGHKGAVHCATFAPDGKTVLSGSDDRTARVWEVASGQALVIPHDKEVLAAVFSHDGRRVITGGVDSTANVWDSATGKKLALEFQDGGTMTSLATSADGNHMVSGSWDSTTRLWNATNGQIERVFLGHAKGVFGVAISPDGTRIATAAHEGSVKIWDASDRSEPIRVDGPNSEMLGVAISPDGERIAIGSGKYDVAGTVSGSGDNAAQLWDSKRKTKLLTLQGHKLGVSSVAFSPDGAQVLTGSGDGTAKLWHAATGRLLRSFNGHAASVSSVAFTPDGARVLTGSIDQTARVWDVATGREIFKLRGNTGPISSVATSSDGTRILTGSFEADALIWNAATGERERTIATGLERVNSVAFSRDSRSVLAAGWNNEANLWDLSNVSAKPIAFKGHSSIITSSAFSPNGRQLVTGSADNTARVWETSTGRELLRLSGHGGLVNSVAFSSDGQRIISGSNDKTVRIWEAALPSQVAAWEEEERLASNNARAK